LIVASSTDRRHRDDRYDDEVHGARGPHRRDLRHHDGEHRNNRDHEDGEGDRQHTASDRDDDDDERRGTRTYPIAGNLDRLSGATRAPTGLR
jgi:hypothetical protein